MPRMCNCYGCSGNYPAQPYTKSVSFPNDPENVNGGFKLCQTTQHRCDHSNKLTSAPLILIVRGNLVDEGHARLNHHLFFLRTFPSHA